MRSAFYKPQDGWLGDCIPFYTGGEFRLFYLHDQRDGMGFSWHQIGTHDFVQYNSYGEALPKGLESDPDRSVWTGSVIEVSGLYHLFYTGYNPVPTHENQMPRQAIMHAVSKDLKKFEKIKEHTFYSTSEIYETVDWRDPYVFWNNEDNAYWMLVTARLNHGPSNRRGCIALCKSKNLSDWTIYEPFWAPNLYNVMECPDLFRIGEWWYLIYSTFSDRFVTQYRMSRSLSGPWIAPENDTFDGRGFYAAKSCTDGNKRYLFGWLPTKENASDFGAWHWGGNLVVHQIEQKNDGSLTVQVPKNIDRVFNSHQNIKINSINKSCHVDQQDVSLNALDQFTYAMIRNNLRQFRLSLTLTFDDLTRGCGVILGAPNDLESAYYIRLEPAKNRLVFDMWPRKIPGVHPMEIGGDIPFQPGMERTIRLVPGDMYNFKIFVDGTICIAYLNDTIALSSRIYSKSHFNIGLFTNEGNVHFSDVKLSTIN